VGSTGALPLRMLGSSSGTSILQFSADRLLDAVSVLDSVVAHALRAGLALQGVRPGGLEAAAGVDHALGQLDEIVRQVRDLAFQLRGPGTRIRRLGPDSTGRSGT
jgi:hypothetical protein